MGDQDYNLEDRLLDYGARVISLTKGLPAEFAERHIAQQLLRSGTAPLSHHGEAQSAESPADFIHKMSLALKELRESWRWLRLLEHSGLVPSGRSIDELIDETDQLIRIFVASIATARRNRDKDGEP